MKNIISISEYPKAMANRKHFKQVLKDMFLYGAVGASSQLANLLLLPLLTRLFSTKEYGVADLVAISSSLANVGMTLCIPSAIIRFFHEKSLNDRAAMVSSVLIFCIFTSASLCLFLILLTPILIETTVNNLAYIPYFRLGWVTAAVTAPVALIAAVLKAERRITTFGIVNLTQLLSQIVLSIVFVGVLRMGVPGVLWASVASGTLSLTLGIFFTRKWIRFSFSWTACKEVLAYSLPMVPVVFSTWINQRGTRFLIVFYLTLSEVGVYGVAVLLSGAVSFVTTAFQNSWNSYVMTLLNHDSFDDINRSMLSLYMGGLIVLALPFQAVLKDVCMYFLDPKYLAVLPLIPWLVGGVILQGSGNITSIGLTISKRTIIINLCSWSGVGLNIAMSFFLIPLIGLRGAAIGFFCSQLVFTLLLMVNTYRTHTLRFKHMTFLILLVFYLLCSQLIAWLGIYSDGFAWRYLAGAAGSFFVFHYLNIWPSIIASMKSRIPHS